MNDFRKTYRATVVFNDSEGPDRFLTQIAKYGLAEYFCSAQESFTVQLSNDGTLKGLKMEIEGKSLNDKSDFRDLLEGLDKIESLALNR